MLAVQLGQAAVILAVGGSIGLAAAGIGKGLQLWQRGKGEAYLGQALVMAARRGQLPEAAESALTALRAHPLGEGAAPIGHVVERRGTISPVRLRTALGAERPLDLLSGMDLPRIC